MNVVLSCTIKKDFEYNKVMPTFHHWKTGDKKFGLTFQTAADARAFDKGVRMAVEELLDEMEDSRLLTVTPIYTRSAIARELQSEWVDWAGVSASGSPSLAFADLRSLSGSSQLQKYNTEAGDDDVFMWVESRQATHQPRFRHMQPDGTGRTGSSNPPNQPSKSPGVHHASTYGGAADLGRLQAESDMGPTVIPRLFHRAVRLDYIHPSPTSFHPLASELPTTHLQCGPRRVQTLNLPVERGDSRSSSDSSTRGGSSRHATPPTESHHLHRIQYIARPRERDPSPPDKKDPENYSYVQLTAVHEYIYPVVEERGDSAGSLKKRALDAPIQPPLPSKSCRKKERPRIRCRHCQEEYSEDDNARGSCEYAPDCVRSGINIVACISCAEGVQYHCMADAEGEFAQHPCECAGGDETCCRRWLGLALLSLLFPCLWCYPPLRACHWCGVACGICGGRHRPAS
uniref:WH1 domain-containing protein n=1 Tax=Timema douglasi TaxID=61478 RepID=A0A7R8VTT3_TIMDO|nr:unnamed protein product [Timema douglasi]